MIFLQQGGIFRRRAVFFQPLFEGGFHLSVALFDAKAVQHRVDQGVRGDHHPVTQLFHHSARHGGVGDLRIDGARQQRLGGLRVGGINAQRNRLQPLLHAVVGGELLQLSQPGGGAHRADFMAAERFRGLRLVVAAFAGEDRFPAFQVRHHIDHLQAFGGNVHRRVGDIEAPALQPGDQVGEAGIDIHCFTAHSLRQTIEQLDVKPGRFIVLHVLVGEKGHVRTGGDFAVLLKSQRAKRCQRAGCAEQQGQRAWCEKACHKTSGGWANYMLARSAPAC